MTYLLTQARLEHWRDSLCLQPLVEDMHDLCREWNKERLAAYLWLSLQRSFCVRLDERLHSCLLRTPREELGSHLVVHQDILQPLRILVDGSAKSC